MVIVRCTKCGKYFVDHDPMETKAWLEFHICEPVKKEGKENRKK